MQTTQTHDRGPFVPYRVSSREKPLGRLEQLWWLANNPVNSWIKPHYHMPIIAGPSLLGPVVVVSDPAGIRHVLVDHATNYEKDPLQLRVLGAGERKNSGTGLLVASGDLWRRTRRTLAPLFTPRRVATFADVMRKRADARVDRWLKRRPGSILEIDREMTGVTYDILSATLFSDALAGDAAAIEKELTTLLDSIGRIHPMDALNFPDWLPRIGRGRTVRSRAYFETAMENLLASRIAEVEQGREVPDDLMSALLLASDPETGKGLSRADVAANLFTFIAAGHETTARGLAWTLYLISCVPEWEARCVEEARSASNDPAQWLETMPAIRAAFEESMRLFPPVPHMSRISGAADRIGDVDIEKNCLVVIAPWLVHRHRLLWKDPDAFVPERFMPGHRESIDRFAYLPFGAGPRVCIGQVFAMQEAVIVLASILRRVHLRHIGPAPRPVHRITLRPAERLAMACEPRG